MPRNSSGTMTLPAPGVPFQSGQVISSAQVNATFSDVATEISDSASRSGKGGFTAQVRGVDGSVAAPAVSFVSEPASGLYRAGATDVRLALGGVDFLTRGGILFPVTGATLAVTGADAQIVLQGNRNAASTTTEVAIVPSVTRTAGLLLQLFNSIPRLAIDYLGLLRLDAGAAAAAIQPASILTSLTVGANWTINGNLAFWKDASGAVHLQGGATPGVGAVGTIFTLPVGFRPRADATSQFVVAIGSSGTTGVVVISGINGACSAVSAISTGAQVAFDSITFLAGQ